MIKEEKFLGNKRSRIKLKNLLNGQSKYTNKKSPQSSKSISQLEHKCNLLTHSQTTTPNSLHSPDLKAMNHKSIIYEVDSWSSYISNFHPKNILSDIKTAGQVSKWSVDFKSQNEYLFLKLEKPSIIYSITFGKFKDPTNLKEFKVFGGLDKSDMIELVHSGLSQEEGYEAFMLKFKHEGVLIPCRWIKIIPIRPWNDSYNISIWFVNLKGVDEEVLLTKSESEILYKKERASLKSWISLTRKHFKQDSLSLFSTENLKQRITSLEDPIITHLFSQIIEGNFLKCLETVDSIAKGKDFDSWINQQDCVIEWRRVDFLNKEIEYTLRILSHNIKTNLEKGKCEENSHKDNLIPDVTSIHTGNNINSSLNLNNVNNIQADSLPFEIHNNYNIQSDASEEDELELDSKLSGFSMFSACESIKSEKPVYFYPCGRGGHSMVLDEENNKFYIFGGWDGTNDLNDFWSFDLKTEVWEQLPLSEKTPSKRSCHKMVIDSINHRILLFGKYSPVNEPQLDKALYEFNLNSFTWRRVEVLLELKENEFISGGPGQVYDHALLFDREENALFLFGGIKVEGEGSNKYNNLWKLHLNGLCFWESLTTETQDPYEIKLKTRGAHSMIINKNRELVIWGGSKGPRKLNAPNYLFDMTALNLNTGKISEYFHDYSKQGPNVNFSSCSFYDASRNEVFIFGGGLSNDKSDILTNNFWIYNFENEKWSICKSESKADYDSINFANNFYYSEFNKASLLLNSPQETLNEPAPRYAHCMVYSQKLKKGFVFGGNSNLRNLSKNVERLDDLWSFKLKRKDKSELVEEIKYDVLKVYYEELCEDFEIEKALEVFSQLKVISKLNNNLKDVLNIEELGFNLVKSEKSSEVITFKRRYELFERIFKYFPKYEEM